MTILFVRPLFKIDKTSHIDQQTSRLKEVARRTMVASVVCLIVSFANVAALTILKGVERGAVCLTCCYMDVMINVVTIHWVTSQPSANKSTQGPISQINNNAKNDTFLSSDQSHIQTQTISSIDNKKKKNIKHDSLNEQYGEFGNQHHHWPAYANPHHQSLTSTYYMSAKNNQIITSPVIHGNDPIHYSEVTELSQPFYSTNNTNGRYIIVTEKEDEEMKEDPSRSRSSSIQESYSSKQSLTKTNLN